MILSKNVIIGLIFLMIGFGTTIVIIYLDSIKKELNSKLLLMSLGTIFFWNVSSGLSYIATNPSVKIFFHELKFIGVSLLPIFNMLFVYSYIRERRPNTKKLLSFLLIIPVIVWLSIITNPLFHLFREEIFVGSNGEFTVVHTTNGIMFYIHTGYSYALNLFAFIVVVLKWSESKGIYKKQFLMMLLAFFLPTGLNALYIYNRSFGLEVDFTPIGFSVAVCLLAYGILSYQLNRLVPIARNYVFKKMSHGIIVTDTKWDILDYNDTIKDNSLVNIESFMGKHLNHFLSQYHVSMAEILDSGYKIGVNDNTYMLNISQILDDRQRLIGYSLDCINITEQEKVMKRIEEFSYTDSLTGIRNRAFFTKMIMELDMKDNLPLGIIMADLDGLKIINDGLGHEAGDKTIKTIAAHLEKAALQKDVVCRIGGDEFAVLMPNCNKQRIKTYIGTVQREIDNTKENLLSLSIGYNIKYRLQQVLTEVINVADTSMYMNKMKKSKNFHLHVLEYLYNKLNNLFIATFSRQEYQNITHDFGQHIHYSGDKLYDLVQVARYHDIGMVLIPEEVLRKDVHNEDEVLMIKSHVVRSANILKASKEYRQLANDVLYHHEHYDGTGYPEGIKGKDIPKVSRILAIIDEYVKLKYDHNGTLDEQMNRLKEKEGTILDPGLTEVFIKWIANKEGV